MPTSRGKAKERYKEFFYYGLHGKRLDEALHREILDEGDHAAAAAVSRQVALKIGLTPAEIDSLMGRVDPTKAYDESEHPRDEHGRWTDAGGGDGGGAEPSGGTGAVKPPSSEQLWKWDLQVRDRQDEIAKTPDQMGGKEDTELQYMAGAISLYLRTKQEHINSGVVAMRVVHEGDKLLAAVTSRYDERKATAEITFAGGLEKTALRDALRSTLDHLGPIGAKRVDGYVFADDNEKVKTYIDAGFRLPKGETEAGGNLGIVHLIAGEEGNTKEEIHEAGAADRAHLQMVRGMASSVAKDLGFDKSKITVMETGQTDPDENFVLNGKQFKAAGLAYTRSQDPALKGTIKLFPGRIWDEKAAERVTAHEIQHIKFQNAIERYKTERDAVNREPGPPPNPDAESRWERLGGFEAVMAPDGTLRPAYAQKYPAYALLADKLLGPSPADFAKGDGVSSYSDEYWKQWEAKEKAGSYYMSAQHETLAEMAAARYATGKFPEHKGETKAAKDRNAKIWRELYRAVQKIWDLP